MSSNVSVLLALGLIVVGLVLLAQAFSKAKSPAAAFQRYEQSLPTYPKRWNLVVGMIFVLSGMGFLLFT